MSGLNLRGLSVLIVEDNFNFRVLLRNILKAMGVGHIEEAANGESALKLLANNECDLVITDWKMEPVDGLELARQLRRNDDSPNRFVPIIMISGFAEQERVMAARDAGINEFLAKPISAKALLSRMERIVDRPRPFIRSEKYFGPDRRRHQGEHTGPERRKATQG